MPKKTIAIPKDVPLEEPEYHQIARWLGEFIPPMRIGELVFQTFHKKIDPMYAYNFQRRKKWALLIDRYRQEWIVKVAEVPLAHKKYRLEKLQKLIERLDLQNAQGSVAPHKYEVRLLRLLTHARLEMEEKKEEHTWFFTNVQLNNASDAELIQRREALLKRIQQFRLPLRTGGTDGLRHGLETIEATTREAPEDDGGDGHGDPEDDRPVEGAPPQG